MSDNKTNSQSSAEQTSSEKKRKRQNKPANDDGCQPVQKKIYSGIARDIGPLVVRASFHALPETVSYDPQPIELVFGYCEHELCDADIGAYNYFERKGTPAEKRRLLRGWSVKAKKHFRVCLQGAIETMNHITGQQPPVLIWHAYGSSEMDQAKDCYEALRLLGYKAIGRDGDFLSSLPDVKKPHDKKHRAQAFVRTCQPISPVVKDVKLFQAANESVVARCVNEKQEFKIFAADIGLLTQIGRRLDNLATKTTRRISDVGHVSSTAEIDKDELDENRLTLFVETHRLAPLARGAKLGKRLLERHIREVVALFDRLGVDMGYAVYRGESVTPLHATHAALYAFQENGFALVEEESDLITVPDGGFPEEDCLKSDTCNNPETEEVWLEFSK